MRVIYAIASIPVQNMKDCVERVKELEMLGYTDVHYVDITDKVLLPLSTYLQAQTHSHTQAHSHAFIQSGIRMDIFRSYATFAKFLQWAALSDLLSFVIIVARRPQESED